jgi:hypothetical protein
MDFHLKAGDQSLLSRNIHASAALQHLIDREIQKPNGLDFLPYFHHQTLFLK